MELYETREQWLNAFIDGARPIFEAAGQPIPINIRVSVGFTSTGSKSSDLAEIWLPAASSDGHYEIFVNPTTETEAAICAAVTNELCHAARGNHKNDRKGFGPLARAVGLNGPLTNTEAGPNWYTWATPIIMELGPMPYAEIRADAIAPKPKKATFTLKVECPECGWLARVTKKHILPHSHLACPVPDCNGELTTEF